MRVASLLTVLSCAFLISGGSASAGHTKAPGEKHVNQHVSQAQTVETCHDARRAIVYYRGETWKAQDTLRQGHWQTFYPERSKGHCAYKRFTAKKWQYRLHNLHSLLQSFERDHRMAISYVFGEYAEEAIEVASCESHLRTDARNGQYLGMFQMGGYARELYGHSSDPLGQAFSAHAYFMASGRDWSPWSCKPWSNS